MFRQRDGRWRRRWRLVHPELRRRRAPHPPGLRPLARLHGPLGCRPAMDRGRPRDVAHCQRHRRGLLLLAPPWRRPEDHPLLRRRAAGGAPVLLRHAARVARPGGRAALPDAARPLGARLQGGDRDAPAAPRGVRPADLPLRRPPRRRGLAGVDGDRQPALQRRGQVADALLLAPRRRRLDAAARAADGQDRQRGVPRRLLLPHRQVLVPLRVRPPPRRRRAMATAARPLHLRLPRRRPRVRAVQARPQPARRARGRRRRRRRPAARRALLGMPPPECTDGRQGVQDGVGGGGGGPRALAGDGPRRARALAGPRRRARALRCGVPRDQEELCLLRRARQCPASALGYRHGFRGKCFGADSASTISGR
ncbi:hypothetical protein DAI22_05g037600 [Oryza sativa Japonica Group]|nr:hypothetical protein DAI22_05g037600 [Oryza sativa Japonica Group]